MHNDLYPHDELRTKIFLMDLGVILNVVAAAVIATFNYVPLLVLLLAGFFFYQSHKFRERLRVKRVKDLNNPTTQK